MEISLFLHGIKDILPRSDDKNLHSKWKNDLSLLSIADE